jgi:RNA ligase
MNFFKYLGVDQETFIEKYLHGGWVTEGIHKTLPLNIFTYSRKCQQEDNWDSVISKCRGIVVDRWTGEIVARPFEKFHNYGSPQAEGTLFDARVQPTVWEKMDGFMVTAFKYEGVWHAASKSSFHSIHAKWATAELRKHANDFPDGWTPVFEGLHPDLRIVVNYGDRKELVLLGLINIETGEEMTPAKLRTLSADYNVPDQHMITLAEAKEHTLDDVKNDEGYVLTWYQEGKPPVRLKMKYVEYLRLHRMVCGVSPKRIWESLSQPHLAADLRDYLDNSTPWFAAFVRKWVKALQTRFDELQQKATEVYMRTVHEMAPRHLAGEFANLGAFRKAYALEFNKPENADVRAIMFAMLDGKDSSSVIWKQVKALTEGGHPMADAHSI